MMLRHAPDLERQVPWEEARHQPTSAASCATRTIAVQPPPVTSAVSSQYVRWWVLLGRSRMDTQTSKAKERVLNRETVC
jgi:hypothetical protein